MEADSNQALESASFWYLPFDAIHEIAIKEARQEGRSQQKDEIAIAEGDQKAFYEPKDDVLRAFAEDEIETAEEDEKDFYELKDDVLRAFADIPAETRRRELLGIKVLDLSPVISSKYRQLGMEGMSALVQIIEEGKFDDFRILDLSENEAGSEAVAKLASSFKSNVWRQLQQLRLSGNRVGDVGVRALADGILSNQLSGLEYLDLSFNHIGDRGAKSIAELLRLGRLRNLQTLDLSFNEFGDEGTAALAQSFECGQMSKLKSLNLSHNVIENVGARALAELFTAKHITNLGVLDLSFNKIQDEGALVLGSFFQSGDHPNNLLGLSDNSIGYSATKMTDLLKEFLSGAWQTLQGREGKFKVKEDFSAQTQSGSKSRTLLLSGPGFVGDMRSVALVKALPSGTCGKWESLVLHDHIGGEGATALAECLQSSQFKALRNLDLSESTLGDAGLTALAIAFQTPGLDHLEFLDLSNNGVGNSGAMALAESFALGHMSSVMAVDLKGNRVGYEGAKALVGSYLLGRWDEVEPFEAKAVLTPAESPDGLTKSRVLYLARNEERALVLAKSLEAGLFRNADAIELQNEGLSDTEVMLFAEALRSGTFSKLRTVDFSKNNITDLGLISLLHSTHAGNAAGLDLDLSYNRIGDAGAKVLAESYREGQSSAVRRLNLNYNSGITEAAVIALILAFHHSGEWHKLRLVHFTEYKNGDKSLKIGPGGDWELKKLLEELGVQSRQFGQIKNLRTLKIKNRVASHADIVALAKALRSGIFGRLEYINVLWESGNNEEIIEIAGALEAAHVPFLKVLKLFRYPFEVDQISEAAAQALVNAYRTNTTLTASICSKKIYWKRGAARGVVRDIDILRQRNAAAGGCSGICEGTN